MSFLIGRLGCLGSTTIRRSRTDGVPVFRHTSSTRSIRDVLDDKTGAGIAEGLAGVLLIIVLASMLALGVTQSTGAVTGIATKAERRAYITQLVGDRHQGAAWGTPERPSTQSVTLPNGHEIEVTTWREATPSSVRLTAVAPVISGPDAADCTGPSDIAKTGCVYASRLHADDLDALEPHAIIRAAPSGGDVVGSVDPHVTTDTAIPQGTTFASGSDDSATVWRYLIDAHSLGSAGEIRITQQDKKLAVIPIDSTDQNYFGTLVTVKNVPVQVTVTSGDAVVKTVFVYRAGSTL